MSKMELPLRYGCNPHQVPARIFVENGEMPIRVHSGSPGYINLLDAFNSWQLVKELRQSLDLPAGSGKFVVDISETLAVKLESIHAYETQFPPTKQRVFRLVESQNTLYGTSAGFEAGEVFIAATTLGVQDLMKTVIPDFGAT